MTFNCKDFIDKVDGPTFIVALLIQQYLHVPIIILNVNRNLDKSSAPYLPGYRIKYTSDDGQERR